ncbi:MAG: hypothetical protein HY291_10745 [Planctomycetes bacterium]|nr:hypothetical protein [Planctomycetota bacterium]
MSQVGPNPEPSEKKTPSPKRATFFGTAFHKVSERNQVAIPKHMLKVAVESQEGQLLLMRLNNEGYLRIYTQSQLDEKIDGIRSRADLEVKVRSELVRGLSRNAVPIEPDSQGRFVLPPRWVEELGLRDEVAFCGAFSWIEVWPAAARRDVELKEKELERSAPSSALIAEIMDT